MQGNLCEYIWPKQSKQINRYSIPPGKRSQLKGDVTWGLNHFSLPMCGDARGGTRRDTPRGSCAGGRWEPSPCTPAVGNGWGEKHPESEGRIAGGWGERQSWHGCPWGPLCLDCALQPGDAVALAGGPWAPLPETPLSPARHDRASTVLRQWCFPWKTHLYYFTSSL